MNGKDKEFLKRLQATFRVEAEEHVRALSAGLIELEKSPPAKRRAELIEAVFREAHSLKGAARSVNLTGIESVCQQIEGAFAALKRGEVAWSRPLCDLFQSAVDHIARLVSSLEAEQTPADRSRLLELVRRLDDASRASAAPPISPTPGEARTAPPTAPEGKPLLTETVRMPAARLAPLLHRRRS